MTYYDMDQFAKRITDLEVRERATDREIDELQARIVALEAFAGIPHADIAPSVPVRIDYDITF